MDELNDMPGHLIRRLHQISTSLFTTRAAKQGIDLTPVQYAALVVIGDNPRVDQATLAGLIAHDRATIGGVVDRLTQKGHVARRVNRKDRRARELELTAAGREILEQARPAVTELQSQILSGLNPEEQATFVGLLRKATEAGNDLSRAPLRRRLSGGDS